MQCILMAWQLLGLHVQGKTPGLHGTLLSDWAQWGRTEVCWMRTGVGTEFLPLLKMGSFSRIKLLWLNRMWVSKRAKSSVGHPETPPRLACAMNCSYGAVITVAVPNHLPGHNWDAMRSLGFRKVSMTMQLVWNGWESFEWLPSVCDSLTAKQTGCTGHLKWILNRFAVLIAFNFTSSQSGGNFFVWK